MQPLTSTRLSEKMSTDRAALDQLLTDTFLGHVSFVDDEDMPVAMPTAVTLWGDRLLTHGSTGSRWMRMIGDGRPTCISITQVDGLVVARSAFESSVLYRSAMIFGSFAPVSPDDKAEALDLLTDRLIPGRVAEVRASTKRELAATTMLAMPLERWSLRVSNEMPEDEPDDIAGPAWAGLIRYGAPTVDVIPAPDLRSGIDVPASVTRAAAPRT